MPTVGLPSIQQLDRYRLAALIQAVEQDLRSLWIDQVVRARPEEDFLGPYLAKARENLSRGGDAEVDHSEPLVSFLDFGDVVDILARNTDEFEDREVARALGASVVSLKAVIPARNRVAHNRPLPSGAVTLVIASLDEALKSGVPMDQVAFVAAQIRMDPDWLPGRAIHPQPWEKPVSRVLHNVPFHEHEDTGLVGRQREVDELFRLLKARRYPAFSVLGPGGTGKTALGLEVLWRLIDEGDPFEAILYASLKGERLTVDGIQALSAPVLSVSDAFDELARPLLDDFEASAAELASALEGIPALLVIDNLETDIGADVEALLSRLPDDTTLLITSRIGLPSGFGDKALHLQQLSSGSAGHLFRSYARARNQLHLAALGEDQVNGICDRLGRSPLGIRWLVSSVEAGVRIESILEERTDLITFCVGNVFASLSSDAKQIAAALAVASTPTSAKRLSLLSDESNLDAVRLAVRELQSSSLATAVADPDGYEAFSLTEMALAHVDDLKGFRRELDEARHSSLQWEAAEERRRRDESNLLSPNAVFLRNPTDRDSALLLRKALLTVKSDFRLAVEQISTARTLSPTFYEVDRVLAFVEAHERNDESALGHYLQAVDRAPDDRGKARCKYHLANHLVRMQRAHDALDYAKFAHETLNQDGTQFLLARTLLFANEKDEAISLLAEVAATATGRLKVMALTALVDAFKRQAEDLRRDAQPRPALDASVSGLAAYDKRSVVEDRRLHETAIECAGEGLGAAIDLTDPEQASDQLWTILTSLQHNPAWRAFRERPRMVRRLERLQARVGPELADTIRGLLSGRKAVRDTKRAGRAVARVIDFSCEKGFGFAVDGDGSQYFFHRNDVVEQSDLVFLHVDAEVSFRPEPADASDLEPGKYQSARQIEIELSGPARLAALEDRAGTIVYTNRGLVIVQDRLSGTSAAVTSEDLSTGLSIAAFPIGAEVTYSLDEGTDGWLRGFRTRRGDYRYAVRTHTLVPVQPPA